jgi:hypothetical protein
MILFDTSRVLGLVVVVVGLVVIENVLRTMVNSASSQRCSGVWVVVDLTHHLNIHLDWAECFHAGKDTGMPLSAAIWHGALGITDCSSFTVSSLLLQTPRSFSA